MTRYFAQIEDELAHANDPLPELPDNKEALELVKSNRGNKTVGFWNLSKGIMRSLIV